MREEGISTTRRRIHRVKGEIYPFQTSLKRRKLVGNFGRNCNGKLKVDIGVVRSYTGRRGGARAAARPGRIRRLGNTISGPFFTIFEARLEESEGEEGGRRRESAPSALATLGTFWAASRPGPTLGMTNLPRKEPVTRQEDGEKPDATSLVKRNPIISLATSIRIYIHDHHHVWRLGRDWTSCHHERCRLLRPH